MAASKITPFPATGGPLVFVPSADDSSFVSYFVQPTKRKVEVTDPVAGQPNLGWHPIFAVRVDSGRLTKRAINNSPIQVNNTISRIGFMLSELSSSEGVTTPPEVEWQVRASYEELSEVVASGTIVLNSFDEYGLIVQVSGFLATQFEFWARVNSTQADPSAVFIALSVLLDRFHGAPRDVFKGSVSV